MNEHIWSHVLVLNDGNLIKLTSQEANHVSNALSSKFDPLSIQETQVPSHSVSFLTTIQGFEDMKRMKAGEWKCLKGHWHVKNEQSCKEIEVERVETIELLDGQGNVSMSEILKDQKLSEDKQKYARDSQRGGWIIRKTTV